MRNTDLFDDYLFGKLNPEQTLEFETRLQSDEVFAKAFEEHRILFKLLNQHEEHFQLKQTLKSIHRKEFGSEAKIIPIQREKFIQKFGKNVAMVAGVGLVAVLSTLALLSTGGYLLTKQSNEITDLKRDIVELKYSQEAIVKGITNAGEKKIKYAPANFEGTGFALNNKGYVITSWHMVNGADSIFIENSVTERSLTKIVFSDPKIDIAILKIENETIATNWQIPFAFNTKPSDLGEKVFTLGYPRKEIVYGEGALSALSGYRNDTAMYQVSIPVNPGNSGGPLLDEQGNIIGVIRGKITNAEATGFAVKSKEIFKTINAIAIDSTKDALSIINKKNSLKGIKRSEQIKRIHPYVFNIMVYKEN
jgi:serine protease Do